MPGDYWQEAVAVLRNILLGSQPHGSRLNERHLHHHFSHSIQARQPAAMDLAGPTQAIRLHPEWPTYNEATGIDCGQYRLTDGRYEPFFGGRRGGFVDFALGEYLTPTVGVEFKLLYGWQGEAVAFDYMKLLDRRNPFRAVAQVTVLIRPNGLPRARGMTDLCQRMTATYAEAIRRLGVNDLTAPDPARRARFVVTELAPGGDRRHWFVPPDAAGFETGTLEVALAE